MSQYEYNVTLTGDQLRILTLLPKNASQEIEVELKTVPLHHDLDYAAISYCWGGPQAKRKIIKCNGRNLEVTESLYGALFCLRRRSETRQALWADAVCINQSNVDEKNVQVPLMGTIYRRASRVYVWLGDLKTRIVRALRSAAQMKAENHVLHRPSPNALYKVFARPWFRRVWVVQEIAMSGDRAMILADPTVMISWPDVMRGCQHIARGLWYDSGPLVFLLKLEDARKKLSASLTNSDTLDPLLTVLTAYRWFEATDRRDKVYALLGIARNDAVSQRIDIDYSINFQELCKRVACVHLEYSGNLGLLSMPSYFPRSPVSTSATSATWQPAWSTSDWTIGDARNRAPKPSGYLREYSDLTRLESSARSKPVVNISEDKHYLTLSGILVDKIAIAGQCSDLGGYGMEPEARLSLFAYKTVLDQLRLHVKAFFEAEKIAGIGSAGLYAFTGEDLVAVFGSILLSRYKSKIGDPASGMHKFCSWHSTLNGLRAVNSIRYDGHPIIYWLALLSAYALHYFPKTVKENWPPSWDTHNNHVDFIKRQHVGSRGRNFIRTQKGYLGAGPRESQPGDQIVLFKGGVGPFVIRKSNEDWHLVGEAYIHGLHDESNWNIEPSHYQDISLS